MVYIGLILTIFGLTFFVFAKRKTVFKCGFVAFIVGLIVIVVLSKSRTTYYYKSSEYKVEIIHQTRQNGDQIVCDTIYEFRKR